MNSECSPCLPELPSNQYDKAGPSDLGANVNVPPIFLSHSGSQKPFVEHLYDALRSANHTAFFDQHDLPKGSPFPDNIKRAALGCKLGIVVLSDEFLTSKWPMLELQMLVLQRGVDALVLPLFYKLRPGDLKSPTNLFKWQSDWKKNANEHATQWEKAVELLDSFNGEVFVQGTSETAYIEKVVQRVSTIVRCYVPYDCSWIQGYQRLTEEIARRFEDVKVGRCQELACTQVGLHGVGGLGKTTVCKSMVNFYTSQYLGRSCLIEFPSDGDKKKIAQESKRALKKLTSLSDKFLSNEADSFDEVVALMKEHVTGHGVFLAIDNVWESSQEEAERLLGVGFSVGSKVLLTSRSEQVLRGLLREHGSTSYIGRLPAPEHEEAYQIFQEKFKLGDLRSLVDRSQIDSLLERCRFDGVYHSLALKALAQHVQSVCELRGLKNIEYQLSLILEEISNADLGTVEQVIRLNYDRLPQAKKDMFLDIVMFTITHRIFQFAAGDHGWLCSLYKEFRTTRITALLYELALDGLIQLGPGEDGTPNQGEIGVHDLYVDLARREAANSPRFFIEESTKSMEEMEWERLRRVVLSRNKASLFFKKLRHQECRGLEALVATDIGNRTMVPHFDCLPSLCVLHLDWDWDWEENDSSISQTMETGTSTSEMRISTSEMKRALKRKLGLSTPASRVLRLKGLDQLQILKVSWCNLVQQIEGLDALRKLRRLELSWLKGLKNLDGLSGLIELEALEVRYCRSLKKIPDLSGLARLEELRLIGNHAMEEVEGLSSSLKVIILFFYADGALKKRLDMRGLTCLETLMLRGMSVAKAELSEEYLSSNLKHLSLYRCSSTPRDMSLPHLTLLQSLEIVSDWFIAKLEVGCHSTLKTLHVSNCKVLKEIGGLSALHCLEELTIKKCPRLTKLSGLVDISTRLKHLQLRKCESLDETYQNNTGAQ